MTELKDLYKLYELQDELIEHKLEGYKVSGCIEDAGDIYREFSGRERVAGHYVYEKIKKLEKMIDKLPDGYVPGNKDLYYYDNKNYWSIESRYYDDLTKERGERIKDYLFTLYKLIEITKEFNFGVYISRKEIMLKSLDVIVALCLFAGQFKDLSFKERDDYVIVSIKELRKLIDNYDFKKHYEIEMGWD